jgi:hypothetical protein
VESFFVKLTRRRLKRAIFRSVNAINRFVAEDPIASLPLTNAGDKALECPNKF